MHACVHAFVYALDAFSAVGNSELVELLISHDATISAITVLGWTPLHDAAAEGHVEIIEILTKYGKSKFGWLVNCARR